MIFFPSLFFLHKLVLNISPSISFNDTVVVANVFQITLRSLSRSARSKRGPLPVPVLSEHRALCRLLAACFRAGGTSGLSGPLREHSSTSLTSSSIFLERVEGNNVFTRSNTLSFRATSRQAKLRRNIPSSTREHKTVSKLFLINIFKNSKLLSSGKETFRQHLCTSGCQEVADFLQEWRFYKCSRRAAHSNGGVFIVHIKNDDVKGLISFSRETRIRGCSVMEKDLGFQCWPMFTIIPPNYFFMHFLTLCFCAMLNTTQLTFFKKKITRM